MSSGLNGGITLALAFPPSIQFPVRGLAVELDPISLHIDFKLAKSYDSKN